MLVQTNQEAVSLLASPKNSGLLLLVDQLLKKAQNGLPSQRHRSCILAERLLENFKKNSIVVTPTQVESPLQFVYIMLAKAEEITASPQAHHGILYSFAATLVSNLNYESPQKLINAWKDFSSHLLREEIHRVRAFV